MSQIIRRSFTQNNTRQLSEISESELRSRVPAIFANEADPHKTTDRYAFVHTWYDIVQPIVRELGLVVVRAFQDSTRRGNPLYASHVIELAPRDLIVNVNDVYPMFRYLGSHDGTSKGKGFGALWRLWCANGAVAKTSDIGSYEYKHIGSDKRHEVIETTCEIVSRFPKVLESVNRMKAISLMPSEQFGFATMADNLLRPDAQSRLNPSDVLASRRVADNPDSEGRRDFFTTMQAVQESMLRGGVRTVSTSENGRNGRTRGVTTTRDDTSLNATLWEFADKIAARIQG
jgi:Domain of unknown function (DUF932)